MESSNSNNDLINASNKPVVDTNSSNSGDNDPIPADSALQRTLPDNVSIGSPSTASPSVRSLTLSPEDERRATPTTRNSIQMSRGGSTRQRASSDNTAALIGHHLTSNTAFYDIPVNDAFSELVERYIPPDQRPQRNTATTAENPEGIVNLVVSIFLSCAKLLKYQLDTVCLFLWGKNR
ncbi:hypothetical protein BDB00DRAFT_552352 [Zychaea mexicana]|uniref:uncharacterized protein n=1 Tax=Zychaea mexicana TaxID=64656 RepID=UPI0022FE356F|nr:uncharacterized protein BDB00DRAFT_552352 [Zychaea mexicana]KAI9490514.1 hypothetical protein BDB00DRAFT_552352 [Zychaea mexicana]